MRADLSRLDAAVAELGAEPLDARDKPVPAAAAGRTIAEYVAGRPRLEELGTPLLTLDRAAVEHNVTSMARWCADHDVDHAPHGKTTMAPALFLRQLAAGASAITVANAAQLRVARSFGVPRLHLANELLDPIALRWLAAELAADAGFGFTCWVDSVAAVHLMEQSLAAAAPERPVDVCIEMGFAGGRTGVRDLREGDEVARAVRASSVLRLVGVSGYEGIVAHTTTPADLERVDRYLLSLEQLYRLIGEFETDEPILSAGGSVHFDRVVDRLGGVRDLVPGARLVLRSGAYVAHDDGYYRAASPSTRGSGPRFRAAIHAWLRVLSRPEPALAILDGGRRDLPFDEGLPQPRTAGRVVALNDQHAYLQLEPAGDVQPGEVIRLGLSHPCTAFDKWRMIPVVDDADAEQPRVVDFLRTYF